MFCLTVSNVCFQEIESFQGICTEEVLFLSFWRFICKGLAKSTQWLSSATVLQFQGTPNPGASTGTEVLRRRQSWLPSLFLSLAFYNSLLKEKQVLPFSLKTSHWSTYFWHLSLFLSLEGEILSPATTFSTGHASRPSLIPSSTIIIPWCKSYSLVFQGITSTLSLFWYNSFIMQRQHFLLRRGDKDWIWSVSAPHNPSLCVPGTSGYSAITARATALAGSILRMELHEFWLINARAILVVKYFE